MGMGRQQEKGQCQPWGSLADGFPELSTQKTPYTPNQGQGVGVFGSSTEEHLDTSIQEDLIFLYSL